MGEKEGLIEKIKQQAATIDQLTRHMHILQSQTQLNEVSRQDDSIVREFVKSHPSFHFTLNSQQSSSLSHQQQQQSSTAQYYQPTYTQSKQYAHKLPETPSVAYTINKLVTPSQSDLRPWLNNSMMI